MGMSHEQLQDLKKKDAGLSLAQQSSHQGQFEALDIAEKTGEAADKGAADILAAQTPEAQAAAL